MSKTISNEQINTLSNMTNQLKDNFDDLDKSNDILNDMFNVLGKDLCSNL